MLLPFGEQPPQPVLLLAGQQAASDQQGAAALVEQVGGAAAWAVDPSASTVVGMRCSSSPRYRAPADGTQAIEGSFRKLVAADQYTGVPKSHSLQFCVVVLTREVLR
jgi:hypothetical protein